MQILNTSETLDTIELQIYFAVKTLEVDPKKCIIVEDSPKGMESAGLSIVPNLWKVLNSKQVTLENYRSYVNENFDSDGR